MLFLLFCEFVLQQEVTFVISTRLFVNKQQQKKGDGGGGHCVLQTVHEKVSVNTVIEFGKLLCKYILRQHACFTREEDRFWLFTATCIHVIILQTCWSLLGFLWLHLILDGCSLVACVPSLTDNQLGDGGLEGLVTVMADLTGLTHLNLAGNTITAAGLKHLAALISSAANSTAAPPLQVSCAVIVVIVVAVIITEQS